MLIPVAKENHVIITKIRKLLKIFCFFPSKSTQVGWQSQISLLLEECLKEMSQQCADAVLNLGGNNNNNNHHHQNEILFILYKECVELLQHFEIPAKNDDERLKLLRSCERMSKKMDKSVLKSHQ